MSNTSGPVPSSNSQLNEILTSFLSAAQQTGSRADTSLPSGQAPIFGTPMLMANVVQTLGKIEAYSGGRWDDVEDWIRNFEDIAKVNNWNEDVKRIQLYSNLTGTAKELYDTLPLNKKQTYEQVKNELKEAFKPYNVHQRYQMIFDKRQLPGEDVNAYAYAILNLFNRTNPGMTEVEKVIHFTRGLNDELRNYMMTY